MSTNKIPTPEVIVEAQQLLATAMATTPDVAHVFVSYSPHVQQVSARAYQGGWSDGLTAEFDKDVYVDSTDAAERLRSLHASLMLTLAEWVNMKPHARTSAKAERLRAAAAKLLADADALTAPEESEPERDEVPPHNTMACAAVKEARDIARYGMPEPGLE